MISTYLIALFNLLYNKYRFNQVHKRFNNIEFLSDDLKNSLDKKFINLEFGIKHTNNELIKQLHDESFKTKLINKINIIESSLEIILQQIKTNSLNTIMRESASI